MRRGKRAAQPLDPQALAGATHNPTEPPKQYRSAEQRRALVIPLIPLQPPCFERHTDWVNYVVQAVEATKDGEAGPLRFLEGRASFNARFNFCCDCTPARAVEMDRQGRCQPDVLQSREQAARKTEGATS